MKDALESRAKKRFEGDYQAVPWMVMHAAVVINKGRRDDEVFTAYRRWMGERVHQASRGVWRKRDALTGVVCGEEQVRRQMGGWCLVGDKDGEWRVDRMSGERSRESQRFQEEAR